MTILDFMKWGPRDRTRDYLRELDGIVEMQRRHNRSTDEALIRTAFDLAMRIHAGQKRKDGKDYIIHPLAVARTCTEYWMDDVSVVSALLHDTVEDAKGVKLTAADIAREFGPEIGRIVEGVTKLKSKGSNPLEVQVESLKKILATAAREDLRTIVIKVFDRHHNVQSIDIFRDRPDKQERISYETRRFYIPMASRIGLFKIAREMENSLMQALNPEAWSFIEKWVGRKQAKVRPIISNIIEQVRLSLEPLGVSCVDKFYHRGIYQVFEQIESRKLGLENLDDVIAFNLTLIVPTEDDCFRALGVLHRLFPHLRDSVHDFINNPKVNSYQSLHTIILVPGLPRLQVIIRTPEIDTKNHLGLIASIRARTKGDSDELVAWIEKLVSSFDLIGTTKDFLDITAKAQFAEVEVITPKGEPMKLPQGATALDFALHIHSEIFLHAKAAEIDGKERRLGTVLKKGQKVRILTDEKVTANPQWLNWTGVSTTRLALKKHLKKQERRLIEAEAEKLAPFLREKIGIRVPLDAALVQTLAAEMGFAGTAELLEDLWTGRLGYEHVVPFLLPRLSVSDCRRIARLLERNRVIAPEEMRDLLAAGSTQACQAALRATIERRLAAKVSPCEYVILPKVRYPVEVHFARCCSPAYSVPIVAITSRGKGAVVHRRDCGAVAPLREYGAASLTEARWTATPPQKRVFIRIEGRDRPNLLHDLTQLFHDVKSNILRISVNVKEGNAFSGEVLFEVSGLVDVHTLSERFRSVQSLTVSDMAVQDPVCS